MSGSPSKSVANRCDEQPIDSMHAAAPTAAHHHTTTTSCKPVDGSGSSGAPPMVQTARRRLQLTRGSHHHRSSIVGGQLPEHRRHTRPVVLPETLLRRAQHPHVQPIYDANIQMDDRTLRNLKDTERDLIVTGLERQSEVLLQHRAAVVQWMRDVLEGAEEEVFPLSVLILDNYLTIQNIMPSDIKDIASACMLMASKLKGVKPINGSFFTDNSFSWSQIMSFELVILRTLKFQIALPTAFDFADKVFCRVPNLRVLRTHFTRALYDMQLNAKDAGSRPSVQASIALTRAAHELAAPPALLEQLRTALAEYLGVAPAAADAAASIPMAQLVSEPEELEETDSALAYPLVYEDAAIAAAAPSVGDEKPVTPP